MKDKQTMKLILVNLIEINDEMVRVYINKQTRYIPIADIKLAISHSNQQMLINTNLDKVIKAKIVTIGGAMDNLLVDYSSAIRILTNSTKEKSANLLKELIRVGYSDNRSKKLTEKFLKFKQSKIKPVEVETVIVDGMSFNRYLNSKIKQVRNYYTYKGVNKLTGETYLHRHVYAMAYGAIPDGMIIHHVDMDSTNNNLDNLLMVTPSQHRRLHTTFKNIFSEISKNG